MGKKEYFDLFERIVRDIENRRISTDRSRQTVFGTTVEHLEHVVRRIRGNITRIRCWLHLRLKISILLRSTVYFCSTAT